MIRDYVGSQWRWLKSLQTSWVWCLSMILLAVVPFLSDLRTGPLSGFYLETAALFFAVVLAALTMLTQDYRVSLPPTSMFFIVLAVLLMVQARVMPLPYVSQSDLTAVIFLGMALLAWAARAWVLRIGQQQAVAMLAWAILIGVLLQTIVCILQFTGETHWFGEMLVNTRQHYVDGQLAQRNHLGHYLMWGVLALCYLWSERRIKTWLAVCLMLWITGVMGLVGSRTIMAYLLAIGASLVFWVWRSEDQTKNYPLFVGIACGFIILWRVQSGFNWKLYYVFLLLISASLVFWYLQGEKRTKNYLLYAVIAYLMVILWRVQLGFNPILYDVFLLVIAASLAFWYWKAEERTKNYPLCAIIAYALLALCWFQSRLNPTLYDAVLLAIFISLVFWVWRSDKQLKNYRLCAIIACALLAILLFQSTLSPILHYLFDIDFQSATERLNDNKFAQSGRQMEWRKAWLVFQSAPIWGHGWGSYAEQGFLQNGAYPHGFRQYEGAVLFTHCHNLILQLLAETGVVGLLVVIGGFVGCVWGYFRRPFNAASVVMVSMMLVSMCHSLLEYPLWYVFFLAVFVLCMSLTPAEAGEENNEAVLWPNWQRWVSLSFCLLMLLGMGYSMVWYTQLLNAQGMSKQVTSGQIKRLQTLRARTYLMRYYVDMVLVNKIGKLGNQPVPDWGAQAAMSAGLYRPYTDTFVRGLYLAKAQQIPAAKAWLAQMGHYYPTLMPSFLDKTAAQPEAPMLVPILNNACTAYMYKTGKTQRCDPAVKS